MASGGERDHDLDSLSIDSVESLDITSLPRNETSYNTSGSPGAVEMVVLLNNKSDVAPTPDAAGAPPMEAAGNPPPTYNDALRNILSQRETQADPQGRGLGGASAGSPGDIETNLDDVEVSEEERIQLLAKYQAEGLLPAPMAQGEDTDEGSNEGASSARPSKQWSIQDTQDHNGGEDIEMESFLASDAAREEARLGDVELTVIHDDDDDNGGFEPRNVDASQAATMQVRGIDTVEYGTSTERPREYDWECPVNIPILSFLVNQIVRGLLRGKDAWPGMSSTKKMMICLIVLLVIGGILLVTLLPASFVYIEYHEYGLVRNKWTGAIDYDEVHEFGCHLMRPQDEILRLQSTAHHVFKTLEVPTNTGLGIEIQVNMQYFLNKAEIPQLLKDYYLNYRGVMESLVLSSIKNLAINFSLDSYRLKRKEVEAAFAERVKDVLEGHHMEFREFQLGKVTIPEAVMERYMRRLLLQIYAEREYFLQDRSVELKKTEKDVKEIENRALEVRELATAEALVINKKAEAEADMNIQLAYQQAMTDMFARLNVTKEEHKLSFMFVKTLEDVRGNNNLFSYGYSKNTAFTP